MINEYATYCVTRHKRIHAREQIVPIQLFQLRGVKANKKHSFNENLFCVENLGFRIGNDIQQFHGFINVYCTNKNIKLRNYLKLHEN